MKFFVDENLPVSTAETIRSEGFEAVHVREESLRGTGDTEIAEYAKDNGFILVTKDLEFGSPMHYSADEHVGVLIVRLSNSLGVDRVNSRIREFLEMAEDLGGRVTVLEEDRYRNRPLGDE